jgi:hypothetical protein
MQPSRPDLARSLVLYAIYYPVDQLTRQARRRSLGGGRDKAPSTPLPRTPRNQTIKQSRAR